MKKYNNFKKSKYAIFLLVLTSILICVGCWYISKKDVDTADCSTESREFLKWYADNTNIISDAQSSMVDKNDEGFYITNSNKILAYIYLLRQSGFFAEEFLTTLGNELDVKGKKMEVEHIIDGPVLGFTDGDLFWGQEYYDYYLPLMPDRIVINIVKNDSNEKVLTLADYRTYTFDGNCKIVKVENL